MALAVLKPGVFGGDLKERAIEAVSFMIPGEDGPEIKPAASLPIESLFGRRGVDGGMETALTRIFSMWNLNYETLGGLDPCADAFYAGLRCFQWYGSWSALKGINRPALISLLNGEKKRLYAVVSALEGNKVTLFIGGRVVEAEIGDVLPYWSGDYLLLWKPFPAYRRDLRPGMKGQDVAWLRGRLNDLDNVKGEGSTLFDPGLEKRVLSFQKKRGIKADGAVGPLTLIHLNTLTKDASIPVLWKEQ